MFSHSEEGRENRRAKRAKVNGASREQSDRTTVYRKKSPIFAPFRTIGLISPTAVPFASLSLGKTTVQVTTCVGQCLQTYDLRRGLNLMFITRPQTPGPITATVAMADQVLAAWADANQSSVRNATGVWAFKRGKKVGELQMPLDLEESISQIITFGSWIVGCCSRRIEVWDSRTFEHYTTILPPFSGGRNDANVLTGGICAMPTYTNKILAGREDGSVEVWNVRTAKLIYTLQPPSSDSGPVTALEPTPAVSVIGIAYMSGQVVIHDIRSDKQVLSVSAAREGQTPITSISFRTDGLGAGTEGREPGVMATASYNSGDMTLWDLNNGGRKVGTLRDAHRQPTAAEPDSNGGGISKIEFLRGQAILISSGLDNSLKSWIFDETPFSPIPRPLHSRQGHAAPITTLKFLPSAADGTEDIGKWLLSASEDRTLWSWSLRRDAQSTELSQGARQKNTNEFDAFNGQGSTNFDDKKAPQITSIACCLNRDGGMGAMPGVRTTWASAKRTKGSSTATEQNLTGWESIVTGHAGDKFARTWFWGRKRAGRWLLETTDGTEVTSVAITPCGTFAVVGSAMGAIDMYNLQSGILRQRFPQSKLKPQEKKSGKPETNGDGFNDYHSAHLAVSLRQGKHSKAVTGLFVDGLNKTVISAGADGTVKFWDFTTGALLDQIDWSAFTAITRLEYQRHNDLIALICDDHRIRVVDTGTKRLVRELGGGQAGINDACFSHDGRWIICASSDSIVRVWDLPTGHLIDAIRLRSQCKALAFSNTGEYLALAREDNVGIDLWTNRTLFTHAPTRHISEDDIAIVDGPTASGEGGDNVLSTAIEPGEGIPDDESETALPTPGQLSDQITSLSLVPKSRWQTLLHLDLIRERNKPIEPPKAPEKAPFFLPSLDRIQDQAFAQPPNESIEATVSAADRSRIAKIDPTGHERTFSKLLHEGLGADSYGGLIDHIKTLPPSATDIEIRSLNPTTPYEELRGFVDALTERLEARRDYELVQAWMSVFLKCHGEILQESVADDGGVALVAAVKRWRASQQREATRLRNLVGYCSGVIGFMRSAR